MAIALTTTGNFSRTRPATIDYTTTISDRCEALREYQGYTGSVTPEEMGYTVQDWKKFSKMTKENARHAYWAKLTARVTENLEVIELF